MRDRQLETAEGWAIPPFPRWRLSFRVLLVVTLAQILGAIVLPYGFKTRPLLDISYWWLRLIAVLAVPVLLYEARQVSAKRAPGIGLLIDTLLVVPMYLLWGLIWLFSSAPI